MKTIPLLLCFMLFVPNLWAQDMPLNIEISKPLFQTVSEIASVYWTPDSEGLMFRENSIFPDEYDARWYFASATAIGEWAVRVTTADDVQAQMLVLALSGTSQRYIFEFKRGHAYNGEGIVAASPNPNYFVYVGESQVMREGLGEGNGPVTGYPLVLVDVSQNRSIIVPEVIISDLRNANETYQIDWSSDGTALTVYTQSNFAAENIYYVSSYSQDLTAIETQQLEILEIGEILHGISPRFGSLSKDGKRVLLSVVTLTPDGSRRSGLFMWDVENLNASQVLVQDMPVVAAAFDAHEENILFVTREGLLHTVNLQTHIITPISLSLDAITIGSAWFSPDRQRIAVIGYKDNEANLFIVTLPEHEGR